MRALATAALIAATLGAEPIPSAQPAMVLRVSPTAQTSPAEHGAAEHGDHGATAARVTATARVAATVRVTAAVEPVTVRAVPGAGGAALPVRWSDPGTWDGGVAPQAGQVAMIPRGANVLLDVDPPALAGLEIEGTVRVPERDLALAAGYIRVTGLFQIGQARTTPYRKKATITLTGAPGSGPTPMASRGILVAGGTLALYGAAPAVPWAVLNEHGAGSCCRTTTTG